MKRISIILTILAAFVLFSLALRVSNPTVSAQMSDTCADGKVLVMDASNKRYKCMSAYIPLVYRIPSVSLNSANTDVATITGLPSKYIVRRFTVDNASTSLAISAATVDLRTAASGAGTAIVSGQLVTALTGATKFADMTLAVTADTQTAATLYIRCVLAHGGAATVDMTIEVTPLP